MEKFEDDMRIAGISMALGAGLWLLIVQRQRGSVAAVAELIGAIP